MPLVRDIVDEFNKAVLLCPTYGPAYSLAGQIEKFIFNKDCGDGENSIDETINFALNIE